MFPNWISNKIKDFQLSRIVKKASFTPDENFLIFSDPRGGSTWLTEALQCIPNTAVIWEPLHLKYNPEIKKLGFGWRQYIPENEQWEEAKSAFDHMFSGKTLNTHTTLLNGVVDYQKADQLIIKFCRGNALLPWLTKQYKFKYKPIYLVRHPFAVAASQLRQGGWEYPFKGFKIPDSSYNQIYRVHQDFLKTLRTKPEALIAKWCITNQIPLSHRNNDKKWILIHYEKLLLNPVFELSRIFEAWKIPMPDDLYDQIAIESRTTVTPVATKNKEVQLRKWEKQFSQNEIACFSEILNYFQVRHYDSDFMPKEI